MSYATLARLKQRLSVTTDADDLLLEGSLDWADRFIEAWCDRKFSATTATRYFGPDRVDWDGAAQPTPPSYFRGIELPYRRLFLDDDLLTVTTLTNGDATVIPSNGYFLEPFNAPADGVPYSSILLKSSYAWTWDTDGRVSVAGTWGYQAAPDALIVQSALMLAEFHYRSRAPQDLTTVFDSKTKKAKLEGFPEQVLDVLSARRRLAR